MSTSYDAVPYASYPYAQTHPNRMAVVATLLGLKPPALERARVLELGCCSGGNLIPMAEQFQQAQFLGIDASCRQVEDGQKDLADLGLKNVELRHIDIMNVGPELGKFDYILAHGVYSWVPRAVREKILDVCNTNLTPGGVAYVSYNTYPGWRMRGTIRDIMSFRARGFSNPADRVRQARALVGLLARSVSQEDNAYGILLRKELELLNSKDDSYLLHEHLEETNEPCYFHEFVDRARAHGMEYLGEADFGTMSLRNLPEQVATVIGGVAADAIELEQYMDFVSNRMFRQTLLVHAGQKPERNVVPERLASLYVSSSVKPEGPVGDLKTGEQLIFRGPRAATTTTDPLVKAALLYLGEAWPKAVPFAELLALGKSRLDGSAPAVVGARAGGGDARRLAQMLLQGYERGQVDLSITPSPFAAGIPEHPTTTHYARLQASREEWVTNGRHELVRLGDLERHVLPLLDGTRDREQLADDIANLVNEGRLLLHHEGRPIRDRSESREVLPALIDRSLAVLARNALFVN